MLFLHYSRNETVTAALKLMQGSHTCTISEFRVLRIILLNHHLLSSSMIVTAVLGLLMTVISSVGVSWAENVSIPSRISFGSIITSTHSGEGDVGVKVSS